MAVQEWNKKPHIGELSLASRKNFQVHCWNSRVEYDINCKKVDWEGAEEEERRGVEMKVEEKTMKSEEEEDKGLEFRCIHLQLSTEHF